MMSAAPPTGSEPKTACSDVQGLLPATGVLPVATVRGPRQAVGLARALVEGGLTSLEITLRTTDALAAIEAVAAYVPACRVLAGTVTTPEHWRAAADAGARLVVSPGLTPRLIGASVDPPVPLIPGVATASEAMAARDLGFSLLKLFPAAPLGGIGLLRAWAGPLPDLCFCPTGGIDGSTYRDYLALDNVRCVGGSWMVPRDELARGDWGAITARARELTT